MENMDPKTVQQVWQRVTAGASMPGLKPLVYILGETAMMYQKLAQQQSGSTAEKLRKMGARNQRAAAALRGMGHLNGEHIPPAQPKMTKDPDRLLPEKCCRKAQLLAREFELRKHDGEWGKLFDILAKTQWEDAFFLLTVLGERT